MKKSVGLKGVITYFDSGTFMKRGRYPRFHGGKKLDNPVWVSAPVPKEVSP